MSSWNLLPPRNKRRRTSYEEFHHAAAMFRVNVLSGRQRSALRNWQLSGRLLLSICNKNRVSCWNVLSERRSLGPDALSTRYFQRHGWYKTLYRLSKWIYLSWLWTDSARDMSGRLCMYQAIALYAKCPLSRWILLSEWNHDLGSFPKRHNPTTVSVSTRNILFRRRRLRRDPSRRFFVLSKLHRRFLL